ncbi:MAG: hypothetical protein COB84_01905 [Rhodobacteraceae bacterium]|nr:MAG: hypothetical protein COB84_01905 [Paracoccaceae bacterium]
MAEQLTKVTSAVEKTNPIFGAVKKSGGSFLSDAFESTAEFAKSDRERIKKQEAQFASEQQQVAAESFKPKSAKAVKSRRASAAKSNRSESLLTRKV